MKYHIMVAGLAVAAAALMTTKTFADEGQAKPMHTRDPQKFFAKMDANKDGSVSKDEYMAFQKERANKEFEKRGEKGSFDDFYAKKQAKLDERFASLDTNRDGALSEDELAAGVKADEGHKHHMKKMDKACCAGGTNTTSKTENPQP